MLFGVSAQGFFSFILARSIIDIDPAKIIRPRFVVPGKWQLATSKRLPFLRSGLSACLILGILGAFQFVPFNFHASLGPMASLHTRIHPELLARK